MQPVRKTILFLIDASESMLVNDQIKLAKGAVLGLLTRAYQERHRVGVIVFRDSRAEVVLPPTSSITLARNALQALAAGGGTPFAGGLQAVLRVVRSERIRHPNDIQQMILVTDGRPSITMQPGADMRQEVLHIARQFPARNIPAIVLVTEDTCDLIREAAVEMKAPLRKISEVVLQMHSK